MHSLFSLQSMCSSLFCSGELRSSRPSVGALLYNMTIGKQWGVTSEQSFVCLLPLVDIVCLCLLPHTLTAHGRGSVGSSSEVGIAAGQILHSHFSIQYVSGHLFGIWIFTKHETIQNDMIQNTNRQEQLKDRATSFF